MSHSKKILLIDDDRLVITLIRSILAESHPDYEFLYAESGEDGYQIVQDEKPETIILDIFLPGMDGFDVCRMLKSNNKIKHIPVIMLSNAGNDPMIRIQGLDTGADAFISKPFNKFEFIALVNVMLRIKKAEDDLTRQNLEREQSMKNQIKQFLHSEDRFLQISGYALEFFWEIDAHGIITYMSPGIESILGYNPEQIINTPYQDYFPNFTTNRLSNILNNDFKDGRFFKNEQLIFRHKNGRKVWVLTSGFPFWNEKNRFSGHRGVCQDISDRVRTSLDLQRRLAEIRDYQQKLKKLNADLTDVEEKERRRIAEYLHDGMSQTLSLIHIKLTSLLNSEMQPRMASMIYESVSLINTAIKEARTMIYELSPPILYELGLLPAIRWRLEELEKKHQIETKLKCSTDTRSLSNEMKILIYRITNELINNSIKHSGAGYIEVEIQKDLYYLCISVSDNGKGFQFKPKTKYSDLGGFGLFNISERLDSIQGLLQFESKKNKGTKAIVRIPV